nr:hypothetical protein P402_10 [uncultured Acidithrix sp.]ATZ76362.1 hypothetical protein P403_07 [uncultured Acidithrix sp.]
MGQVQDLLPNSLLSIRPKDFGEDTNLNIQKRTSLHQWIRVKAYPESERSKKSDLYPIGTLEICYSKPFHLEELNLSQSSFVDHKTLFKALPAPMIKRGKGPSRPPVGLGDRPCEQK